MGLAKVMSDPQGPGEKPLEGSEPEYNRPDLQLKRLLLLLCGEQAGRGKYGRREISQDPPSVQERGNGGLGLGDSGGGRYILEGRAKPTSMLTDRIYVVKKMGESRTAPRT